MSDDEVSRSPDLKDEKHNDSDDSDNDSSGEQSDNSSKKSAASSRSSGSRKSDNNDKSPAASDHGDSKLKGDDESDSDIEKAKQKRSYRVDNSDDEQSEDGAKKDAKDIFGEVSSDEDEDGGKRKAASDDNEGEKSPSQAQPSLYFGDEEGNQEAEEPPPEMRIEVEIPRVVANLGKELNFVKLPNFLSVDTHPYDPQWYEDEIDDEDILDEEGRARMKLKVENTIRWRSAVDDDGNMHKESNARVVKWSDGSMSLHLGAEIFDIHKQSLMQGDNNHLFIRQGTGLQGQAVFKTKLTFRPYSTDSFTHRKMTLSLADRSQKNHQIKVLPTVGKDPEAHRAEMIKKEEDKLKASIRRENKQRRLRERSHTRGPSASYLEPDGYDDEDDEAGISLSAIKSKFKQGTSYAHTYTDSDDDASDLDVGKRNKRAKVVDSDDDD